MTFGVSFLAFGFFLYYTGQWGGGDAKILSSLGFLLPDFSLNKSVFPFPVSLLFNVFFLGTIYMIAYMIIFSIFNKRIFRTFLDDLRQFRRNEIFLMIAVMVSITLILIPTFPIIGFFRTIYSFLGFFSLATFIYFLYKFVRIVERVGFRRKIKVSELKEGDVLEDSKIWEGLKKEEVERIKKSGKKYVTIKEGVRFAPVFFISLIFTISFGDFIFFVLGF